MRDTLPLNLAAQQSALHFPAGGDFAILIGMDVAKSRFHWFRPTPDRLILGVMAVEVSLLLSQWGRWFPFNRHKGWTVLINVAVVGVTIGLLAAWFAATRSFAAGFSTVFARCYSLLLPSPSRAVGLRPNGSGPHGKE